MTKATFLFALEKELKSLPEQERDDILHEYATHIDAAIESGVGEESVIAKLGTPETIAKKHVVGKIVDLAEREQSTGNVFRAIFALLSLGFFNLIFVLGPFFAVIGVVIGLYAASLGITVGGVGLAAVALFVDLIPQQVMSTEPTNIARAFMLTAGVGFGAMGMLMGILTAVLTKVFYRLTLKYIRLNVKLIKGKPVRS